MPPFLTRLQQRYSAYLQRPGLNRLPTAAFASLARPSDAAAVIKDAPAMVGVAKPAPTQEVLVSQDLVESPTINRSTAEEPTTKAPTPDPEVPKE